jgi:hypothetical protein
MNTIRKSQGYWDTSFLRRAMLAKIGERIGQCYPIEGIPDAIAKLLAQLDDPEDGQGTGSRIKLRTPHS